MRQRTTRQLTLFEDRRPIQAPQLPPEVQRQTRHLLVLWMEALAKAMNSEVANKQDRG
jgi:uncharacterized membrane protein